MRVLAGIQLPIGDQDEPGQLLEGGPLGKFLADTGPGSGKIGLLPDAEAAPFAGGEVEDLAAQVGAEHGPGVIAIYDDLLAGWKALEIAGGVAGLGEGFGEVLFECEGADDQLEGQDGIEAH